MKKKLCPKGKGILGCGKVKPLSDFHHEEASPDKHNRYCKECWNKKSRDYARRMSKGE